MSIRASRLCHHCAVALTADECLHYVFECHACAMAEHDLAAEVRRDPAHPGALLLADGPVEIVAVSRRPAPRPAQRRAA